MSSNLKRLREQQALSLTDLAQKSGVNRITIHRIEKGKQKPMPRTIRKLAEALQVKVEQLNRKGKPGARTD
jgi:transcriptional regulator with XRE-family HTH domain